MHDFIVQGTDKLTLTGLIYNGAILNIAVWRKGTLGDTTAMPIAIIDVPMSRPGLRPYEFAD